MSPTPREPEREAAAVADQDGNSNATHTLHGDDNDALHTPWTIQIARRDDASNIVVKTERDDITDDAAIHEQTETTLRPQPFPSVKRRESEAQESNNTAENINETGQDKKRKRAVSPPWQFPTVRESTVSVNGRRVSARFNTNGNSSASTPAASESDTAQHARARSSSQSVARSRQPSPPWKSFKADGPTSLKVDGKRKSGRVNKELAQPTQPKRVSPRTKKTVDKTKEVAEVKPRPSPREVQPTQVQDTVEERPSSSRKGTRAQSPSTRIAELQAQIAALKPTRSFPSPEAEKKEKSPRKRKRSENGAQGSPRPQSPSTNRRSHRRSDVPTPDAQRPGPRLKLRFSAQKSIFPPPHPNAEHTSPAKPPRPSIHQLLEPMELKEMQAPYQENERGPPTLDWFKQRNEKQAVEEGYLRRRILSASQPNGALSREACGLFHEEAQREPPQPYGHVDHLTAHALYLRSLQIKEKQQHRLQAKKVAYEALEYWKTMRGPTEEDLIAEQDKIYRLVYKQVVSDMRAKWEMVEKHVQQLRKEKWEREEEARRQERLQKQLEQAEAMVKQQRETGDEDTSEMDLDIEDTSDIADSEPGESESGEESGEENMSSSESEGGDDEGEALSGEALRAYQLTRNTEPPDKSAEGSEVEMKHGTDEAVAETGSTGDLLMTDVDADAGEDDDEDEAGDNYQPEAEDTNAATPSESAQIEAKLTSLSPRTARRGPHSLGPAASPDHTGDGEGDDLSDDESTDMYDSDEDMSSSGSDDNGDAEASGEESGEDGNSDGDDGGKLGKTVFGMLFGKKELKSFAGLPTPTTSAEGDARDRERTAEAADVSPTVAEEPQHKDVPVESFSDTDVHAGAEAAHIEHEVDEKTDVTPVDEYQDEPMLPEPAELEQRDRDATNETLADVEEIHSVAPTSAPGSLSSETALDSTAKQLVPIPQLLRGTLRSYQHAGVDWLASLHRAGTNGILADEMGLGKTIQTIALLAHLAEQHGVWETHLVIVPTSVILNWVTEFQKFLPGFRVLGYYGSSEERQHKRKGWVNDPHLEDRNRRGYNVVITSYNVAMQDINAIRNVQWHYLVLDEAHNIRNFNSQRWQVLIRLKTRARLLLTGTPLQNSLTELWSLLTFLTAGDDDPAHGDLEEFLSHWKSPVKDIFERGLSQLSPEAQKCINQLHISLRPFLLRRLKSEVEKDLPKKTESVVVCKLSKRQRQLYQEYMGLASTRESLTKGNAVSAGKVLLSLRRVCNHPDLFDPRPIQTSFAMEKSASDVYATKEQLVRKLLGERIEPPAGCLLVAQEHRRKREGKRSRQLHGVGLLRKQLAEMDSASKERTDPDSLSGVLALQRLKLKTKELQHLRNAIAISETSTSWSPIYGLDLREAVTVRREKPYHFVVRGQQSPTTSLHVWPALGHRPLRLEHLADWHLSRSTRLQKDLLTLDTFSETLHPIITRFAFCTPVVTAPVLGHALPPRQQQLLRASDAYPIDTDFAHEARARTSIVFPDSRLLVYDSGKLQRLSKLLRDLQSRGSRSLIFTQMTGTLNILEQFLNLLGLPYLRLDGSTPVERRQIYSAEFNRPDSKYACMILSSRAGGVGLNLTGASSVIFFDLDWNPQMDRQCMDRAHRIGQVRDVEVYKMVSEKTVEENILRRANQKSLLDQTVIQEGHFTTEYSKAAAEVARDGDGEADEDEVAAAIERYLGGGEKATNQAIESVEDREDVAAANKAQKEEQQDDVDFAERSSKGASAAATPGPAGLAEGDEQDADRKSHVDGYMIQWMEEMLKAFAFVPPVVRKLDRHGRDPGHRPKRKR